MQKYIYRASLLIGAAALMNCGGAEDDCLVQGTCDALENAYLGSDGIPEIDTSAAALTHCEDHCNPGVFDNKRWSCAASPSVPVGYGCSSGWQTCVPGCNPGHFGGSLWSCTADPDLPIGNSCSSGWDYCDPTDCDPSVRVVRWDNDGCSGPGAAADKRRFHSACVLHDQCYGTPGRSKYGCDTQFEGDMLSKCAWYDIPCKAAADAFFIGVTVGAGGAYNRAQNAVRDATIILDHGRSYYP